MRDILAPHFQPIFDRHGAVFAYESFMRLRGDSSGTARFIPSWERSRLIAVADNSMIEHVSKLSCQPSYRGNLSFNLNISPVSIDTDWRGLAHRLGTLRALTRGLTAELSPISAQHNFPRFLQFVGLCKHLRVHIALEDVKPESIFASRRLLETVRPEFLKVDARYLTRAGGSPEHDELLRFVETAADMGIRTMVKNIESADAQKLGVLLGAHYLQGRFFAFESEEVPPPVPQQFIAINAPRGAHRSAGGRLAWAIGPIRELLTARRRRNGT